MAVTFLPVGSRTVLNLEQGDEVVNDMTFRPFNAGDYPKVVQIYNSMYTEAPVTMQELKDHLARFDADYLKHVVGEINGEVVAEYLIRKAPLGENQLKLELYLNKDHTTPARRKQVLHVAYATALSLQPAGFLITVPETFTGWLELYQQAGFSELERTWESRLHLEAFDPAPFTTSFAKAEAAGIRFGTVAELPDNEATQRFLYDTIACTLLPTVPFTESLNIYPFDLWQERVWGNKYRNPESSFIAWYGEEMVGYSELYFTEQPGTMRMGLTAVLPAYRRKGIAMSLKLKAGNYAKTNGIAEITTSNHSINRPMLAINEALGFVRDVAWLTLKKEVT